MATSSPRTCFGGAKKTPNVKARPFVALPGTPIRIDAGIAGSGTSSTQETDMTIDDLKLIHVIWDQDEGLISLTLNTAIKPWPFMATVATTGTGPSSNRGTASTNAGQNNSRRRLAAAIRPGAVSPDVRVQRRTCLPGASTGS